MIGKDGLLSGGQIQRIALARVLIMNSKILILDEVNASLDPENERIIQEVLDKEAKTRSCLTISHRLNTIKDSDSIAVISAGQVKEIGSHDDLLQQNGLYATLVSKMNTNFVDL